MDIGNLKLSYAQALYSKCFSEELPSAIGSTHEQFATRMLRELNKVDQLKVNSGKFSAYYL